jgi:NAD(P)-dependent dehydrogenase (short-subunit alcohol dehydrogenase family)
MEFTGTVAVVTGGSSGIGRAAALAFAREGSDVVIADLNEGGAKEVVAEIEGLGRQGLVVQTDVSKRDEVESLVDQSIAWQGHVDLFYSNAGVAVSGPPHRVPLEDWEWIVDINLWAHIWAVRKVLPHMIERGSGHLVHTASAAGLFGGPTITPYNVTKFAVVGLCESLAIYCYSKGIGVSVVCPMFVQTNIMSLARATPEEGESLDMEERRAFAHQMIQQTGIPASTVADEIVAAVRGRRLYVLPHPEVKGMVSDKWNDPDAWIANASQMWQSMGNILG